MSALNDGARWRHCAECDKPILVNRGSEDDAQAAIFCRRCETGEPEQPTRLVTLNPDGSKLWVPL